MKKKLKNMENIIPEGFPTNHFQINRDQRLLMYRTLNHNIGVLRA